MARSDPPDSTTAVLPGSWLSRYRTVCVLPVPRAMQQNAPLKVLPAGLQRRGVPGDPGDLPFDAVEQARGSTTSGRLIRGRSRNMGPFAAAAQASAPNAMTWPRYTLCSAASRRMSLSSRPARAGLAPATWTRTGSSGSSPGRGAAARTAPRAPRSGRRRS
ncbi:MAG TPA: hypothetical protein VMH35_12830 [Streptosporangiaceae bacterium]|nr:hypothetical protein [Streptosporangiaceae bacterium]